MSGSLKKDYIWNTLGSLAYAAAAALLAFFAMRVFGPEEGGIFGFGYAAFGQQMFIVAYFGTRPFHFTDVKNEYSFAVYRSSRGKTALLAVLAAAVWLGILLVTGTYTASKALCILLLAGIKIADGYADVYECECQRSGFLWRGGRELFFRTLAFSGVFIIAAVVTRNLVISAALSLAAQAAAILIFKKRLAADHGGIFSCEKTEDLRQAEKSLFQKTVFLFAGVFLDFLIVSSSKYAIDIFLTDADSGIYNILFMPANVIYMAANFAMKPAISRMAESLEKGDRKAWKAQKKRLLLIIGGLSVLALFGTVLLGKPVLKLFEIILGETYKGKLTACAGEFFLIILGGCLYAFAGLYYYLLVVKRRQKLLFSAYLVIGVLSAVMAALLVKNRGLAGAAASYAASMSLIFAGFFLEDKLSD